MEVTDGWMEGDNVKIGLAAGPFFQFGKWPSAGREDFR
jgi:hypothetical protein